MYLTIPMAFVTSTESVIYIGQHKWRVKNEQCFVIQNVSCSSQDCSAPCLSRICFIRGFQQILWFNITSLFSCTLSISTTIPSCTWVFILQLTNNIIFLLFTFHDNLFMSPKWSFHTFKPKLKVLQISQPQSFWFLCLRELTGLFLVKFTNNSLGSQGYTLYSLNGFTGWS